MNNFNFNGRDNRRPIVALVIAVLVVLGVIGISNASYQSGVMQGMMIGGAQGTQIVVPNSNGDGTQVIPAPAAPRVGPNGYGYGYPAPFVGRRGFDFGGFGILGVLFNVLLIGGIIFLVSRLLFRGVFGWGRWGRGGPGGTGGRGFGGPRGPWGRGPWGGHDDDDAKPGKRDGEVI